MACTQAGAERLERRDGTHYRGTSLMACTQAGVESFERRHARLQLLVGAFQLCG